MQLRNTTLEAYFVATNNAGVDPGLLVKSCSGNLADYRNTKLSHSWDEHVEISKNCALYLGDAFGPLTGDAGISNNKILPYVKSMLGFISGRRAAKFFFSILGKSLFPHLKFSFKTESRYRCVGTIEIPEKYQACGELLIAYNHAYLKIVKTFFQGDEFLFELSGDKRLGTYTYVSKKTALIKYFGMFAESLKRVWLGSHSYYDLLAKNESQYLELLKQRIREQELVKELQYANTMRERSSRTLCHDTANYISILKMAAYNMNSGRKPERMLEILTKNIDSINQIITRAREEELALINKDKKIRLEPINIEHSVLSLIEDFKNELERKKIEIEFEGSLSISELPGGRQEAFRNSVLKNYLSNSIKFSKENSKIMVSSEAIDEKIHVKIIDTGSGMVQEEIDELNSKLVNSSTVGTSGEVGTGFGVGIARGYVEQWGGEVNVEQNYPQGLIVNITMDKFKDIEVPRITLH